MEYTIDQISAQWHILHNSTNIAEKKQADIFLTNFKKSPNAIEMCLQLFQTDNTSNKIFACLVLYQSIKENVNTLIQSKDKFANIKNLIFTQMLPSLEMCPQIVIERVCYSISILMLIGTVTFWQDCIEDILQFAAMSNSNCYFATIILSNFSNELNELQISQKMIYMIKDVLMDKNLQIKNFINLILTNANNVNDKEMFKKLYIKTIDLAKGWISFEINVLAVPNMTKMLIDNIDEENVDNISELFMKMLEFAKSAKIEDNVEGSIEEYLNKVNKDEMTSVEYIIEVIVKYLSNNKIDDDILNGLSKIFSSISENFIFLFFAKNDLSKKLLELFYFFISYKKRAISNKFFESINNMRTFINSEYKFSNYTNDEKVQFSNYLIRITESVMLNCKMKHFDSDDIMINKGTNANIPIKFSSNMISSNGDNVEIAENEISISDYRQGSEDVFFNIFLIFAENFKNDGVNYFLENIMKILNNNQIDINSDATLSNENILLIIETVLFVIKSIIDCFESMSLDPKPLIQFTSYFLHSKVIHNENLLVKFLLYVESTSLYISYDQAMYVEVVTFLLNIAMKTKQLSQLASIIILNITEGSKIYNEEIFKLIYKIYIEQYDNFEQNPICNFAESLCASVAILDENGNMVPGGVDYDSLLKMFIEVVSPATNRIKLVADMISHSSDLGDKIEKVKYEIVKNYLVHEKVIKRAFLLDKAEFFANFFHNHFVSTYEYTNIIFNAFNATDSSIISSITKIYIKSTQKAEYISINDNIYSQLNAMMLASYSANKENYHTLFVIKNLYSHYLTAVSNREIAPDEKKAKDIAVTFVNLCKVITTNIVTNKQNQIEAIDAFAQFFSTLYEKVNFGTFAETNSNDMVTVAKVISESLDLFVEAMRSIAENSLINNIFRSFTAFIKNSSQELISMKYSTILNSVFFAIDHFSALTISQFVIFIMECLKYDCDMFMSTLRNIFESNEDLKMFKKEHIGLIVDYLSLNRTNEKSVKSVLNDIINITKGMGQLDSLNHYGIEMMRLKITNKAK